MRPPTWGAALHRARLFAAKHLLRLRGVTASSRSLPDYIIIGAMKGGTSSLQHALCQHPRVRRPLIKEVHFFDHNFHQGTDWYRAHFPPLRVKQRTNSITGESSPYYLSHPLAPERAAATVPKCRLIALVRNPADRAWSHYHHAVRHYRESRPFVQAMESSGAAETQDPRFSYLRRGIYHQELGRWFSEFSREQVLVLQSEKLFEEHLRVMPRICDHLGLPRSAPERFAKVNVRRNPPMDPSIRAELCDYFAPHNERLFDLLGERFDWD